MNISTWAILKPTPSILLFIMLAIAGMVGFHNLGVQNMPDMEFPSVTVTLVMPGASPIQLEAEVARPIEDSISSIGGVRHVTTTISDGAVAMVIELAFDKSLPEAMTDVRDAITRIRSTLPTALQEPVITRVNIAGLPVLMYAVSSDNMDESDLSWFVDDIITKSLLHVSGVSQVTRQGGVSREVRVELDPVRLQSLNVTAGEIGRQLRSMQQESPSGRGELGGLRQPVRTLGTVSNAEDLGNLSFPLTDGRRVRINDIANVRDTTVERQQLALLDGKRVVSFSVARARGHDEVSTAKAVRLAVDQLRAANPRVKIAEISNTVDFSVSEYEAAMRMLYEGAILAVLVVWIFLRDWRATLVSAVALPLSIIPTFAVMALMGYKLNTVTLLALTLVIGILVDDAIVEVENIMRHLRMGKPPKKAAIEAATEIGLAVVATSLTLVAVFLPTAFVGGLTGAIFQQFGWTASAAVLFSLAVARLLTPMMAAAFLKPQPHVEEDGALMRGYLKLVTWCLKHRAATVTGAAVIFFGSLMMISQIPSGFLSTEDNTMEFVIIGAPPGSNLEQTTALAERARAVLETIPEVESVFAAIGAGVNVGNMRADSSTGDVRTAQLTIGLYPPESRKRKHIEVQADIRKKLFLIPGAQISVGRGSPGEKMSLMLSGDNPETLMKAARAVEADLRSMPNIGGVKTSAGVLRPEIVIRPDFARASELGITSAEIGQAVRVATTGDYDFNLPRLNLPGRQLYVRVQLDPSAMGALDTIGQLRLMSATGAAVPLSNIAQISVADGPAQIDRYDRHRYVSLAVDLQGRAVGEVLEQARKLPTLKTLPPDVDLVLAGDLEYMSEMMSGFMLAMLAGIFCVYAVMVLLFHDFGQPITVLAALPLAATGALGLLWVFDYSMSMAALIGLLMLIGIVSKNSILLVDYVIMARRDLGMDRLDAVVDACHKRARPIIMTTFAMGAGMMPIALGLDGDSSFRAPMAVVVVGGLITSTLLSLLVVPVVFELVDDMKEKYIPAVRRKLTRT
ncbi:efflux RND transporter permease subunit [Stenotrophobium rhamnosiphilum]|uniref:efflux RND transporter permease subunit n=1 Tax=Stenotrophobium rhamnosiphilum TaxID=2029166 RepID=UPI0014734EF3|nr:efflux RND transporter permease subunit [Stenotrophobium rhamnosiphilum]